MTRPLTPSSLSSPPSPIYPLLSQENYSHDFDDEQDDDDALLKIKIMKNFTMKTIEVKNSSKSKEAFNMDEEDH
ncbi:hypothetical protein QML37_29575 [Klebsiella pneumoniae]